MDSADREMLAREHMELLDKLTNMMRRRFGAFVETEDLRSFAMMGLASAIDRYNPETGVPFSAYATPRIKGAIYDGLVKSSWFPRRLLRKISVYRKSDELMYHANEDPPPNDVVEATHRMADRLKDVAAVYVTTYAAQYDEEQDASPAQAEFDVDRKKYYAMVGAYLETLPTKQRTLLRMYFFEDAQLMDIASHLGHSKSWASRVLRSALANLREKFDEAPGPIEDFQPVVTGRAGSRSHK
jgi:RNA polymerase sigma factor for flagellar operon FliA